MTTSSKIEARLIGERSAGMTAVEIYENDSLVWSHRYFANGATQSSYISGMRQAFDDMIAAEDHRDYEGCDLDVDDEGNGEIVVQDDSATTFIAWTWTPTEGWMYHARDGQTSDFVKHNRDRLPADQLIDFDADE